MEWNRGPTIGRGASATVSIATASTTGKLFAVKSADLSRSISLQREKQFLSQLSFPHIVQYRGDQITFENNTPIYNLFLEYLPRGTISDTVKKNGGSIDESMIRIFTYEILLGINYLHNEGIVHCDIKGQNVLIGKDGVKIADFGSAKWDATSSISGTPAFMAPEVARGEEQSFPADVWALGCTVIEMATGSHPFQHVESPVSVLYRVGFSGDMPEIPETFSGEAKDLLSKCFERDPRQRWTAKELLVHPFFDNLRLNSPKFDPTSVLEQGFWDSVEVPESLPSSVHVSTRPDSRVERILGLISSSNSDFSNWDCDEDWINVREVNTEYENRDSVHIESVVDSETEYSDDVATYVDCCSTYENVLDDFVSVNFDLEIKFMKMMFLFNSSVLKPLPFVSL